MPRVPCKENHDRPGGPGALYVHVPFCVRKCAYCSFYSRPTDPVRIARYVDAVRAELDLRGDVLSRPPASIFVGGGTPTSLDGGRLGELLAPLAALAGPQTEFTVESNPGTVTEQTAAVLAEAGVNRATVGAQSFDDEELHRLGRIHTAADIAPAVERLRAAGIGNVALDLIYGAPGQDLVSWRESVRRALDLRPDHLSCYALSYEPGTPLAADLGAGRVRAADDDLQHRSYYLAVEMALDAGLEHYELSNFARPGRQCRHNLTYWHNRPYLGLGPAAASYVDGIRRTNDPDGDAYAAALADGRQPPHTSEQLAGREAMAEALMLGLRLAEGVDRAKMAEQYGEDPMEAFPHSFARYIAAGALVPEHSRVRIAPEFLFVSDAILADILAEAV